MATAVLTISDAARATGRRFARISTRPLATLELIDYYRERLAER